MTFEATPGSGYQLQPHELTSHAGTLAELSDRTSGLIDSANRLAQRLPMLGTAPPALHLAMRLREAAGQAGLAGDIGAADTELRDFHQTLRTNIANYLDSEGCVADSFRPSDHGGRT